MTSQGLEARGPARVSRELAPLLRVWAVARRHAYVLRRSPHRLFDVTVWPIVDTVLFGSLGVYFVHQGDGPPAHEQDGDHRQQAEPQLGDVEGVEGEGGQRDHADAHDQLDQPEQGDPGDQLQLPERRHHQAEQVA